MASNNSSVQLPLILALAGTDAQRKALFAVSNGEYEQLTGVLWQVPFPDDCHEIMVPYGCPNLVRIFCEKTSKAGKI